MAISSKKKQKYRLEPMEGTSHEATIDGGGRCNASPSPPPYYSADSDVNVILLHGVFFMLKLRVEREKLNNNKAHMLQKRTRQSAQKRNQYCVIVQQVYIGGDQV